MIVFSAASLIRDPSGNDKDWENPYIDVTQDMWSYQYITELNKAGSPPSSDKFRREEEETRGNLVLYLYNMQTKGVFKDRDKAKKTREKPNFSDVERIPRTTMQSAGPMKTTWWAAPVTPPFPPTTR